MITLVSMGLLLAFLGLVVLYVDSKAKTSEFFDINVTNCMRGFWCIIVLLVHIPAEYQNFIQDALGSFAYIGVTFFFMTSSYGLILGVQKNPEQAMNSFWRRRLPKLLIPMVLVNIVRAITKLCAYDEISALEFISITGFVRQLLLFYFLFWLVFKFSPKKVSWNVKCTVLCSFVIVFSIVIYCLGTNPLFAWPVESFGFMYGILLANYKMKFVSLAKNKWLVKCILACCLSLMLGVTYLAFKNVVFIGDYITKIILGQAILLFILFLNTKLNIGNSVSRFLGGISYEVYLIHDVVFIALTAIYAKMNSGIFVIASVLITIIISLVINKLSKFILALSKLG